jgi:hypothetical protein
MFVGPMAENDHTQWTMFNRLQWQIVDVRDVGTSSMNPVDEGQHLFRVVMMMRLFVFDLIESRLRLVTDSRAQTNDEHHVQSERTHHCQSILPIKLTSGNHVQ